MEENRQLQTRLRVILFGVLGLTLLFVVLAYLATIANGLDESQATELNTVITSSTVSAARGNITDRYGRVLVTNRTEYNVVLNIRTMGDLDDQIKVVRSLLKLCREQKVEWLDEDLPISKRRPTSSPPTPPSSTRPRTGGGPRPGWAGCARPWAGPTPATPRRRSWWRP